MHTWKRHIKMNVEEQHENVNCIYWAQGNGHGWTFVNMVMNLVLL
jgi:hypothetical protein